MPDPELGSLRSSLVLQITPVQQNVISLLGRMPITQIFHPSAFPSNTVKIPIHPLMPSGSYVNNSNHQHENTINLHGA